MLLGNVVIAFKARFLVIFPDCKNYNVSIGNLAPCSHIPPAMNKRRPAKNSPRPHIFVAGKPNIVDALFHTLKIPNLLESVNERTRL